MLFATPREVIPLDNGELIVATATWSQAEADSLYTQLLSEIPWQQDYFCIAQRRVPVPRLQAWLGDAGAHYAYSGLSFTPSPWTDTLLAIREQVESIAAHRFNSVLANLYRNENDSVGWHADNEKELGPAPVIASVSFGACRRFQLQHKHRKTLRFELELQHGDILIMAGALQQHWLHQVPKEKIPTPARINLTYRAILNNG